MLLFYLTDVRVNASVTVARRRWRDRPRGAPSQCCSRTAARRRRRTRVEHAREHFARLAVAVPTHKVRTHARRPGAAETESPTTSRARAWSLSRGRLFGSSPRLAARAARSFALALRVHIARGLLQTLAPRDAITRRAFVDVATRRGVGGLDRKPLTEDRHPRWPGTPPGARRRPTQCTHCNTRCSPRSSGRSKTNCCTRRHTRRNGTRNRRGQPQHRARHYKARSRRSSRRGSTRSRSGRGRGNRCRTRGTLLGRPSAPCTRRLAHSARAPLPRTTARNLPCPRRTGSRCRARAMLGSS